jgi:hypothetical protein
MPNPNLNKIIKSSLNKLGNSPNKKGVNLRLPQQEQGLNPYFEMYGERGETPTAPMFAGMSAGVPLNNGAGLSVNYNRMIPMNGDNGPAGYSAAYTFPNRNQVNAGYNMNNQYTVGARIGFAEGGQYKKGGGYFPEYHSYTAPRMSHGGDPSIPELHTGWLNKYEKGGKTKKSKKPVKDNYIDLQKTYGLDPFSKEGIEKARELSRTNPQTRIVCTAAGCSEIAVNAADAYGYDFNRGNAWDLGNKNKVAFTNPAYANQIGKGILQDPTNFNAPNNMFQTGNIVGLNRKNTHVGGAAANRSEADDSYDYANQTIYPNSRGYEHVGYMLDNNTMLHGTGKSATHPAFYMIDSDMSNGAQLPGYNYQPVESIQGDEPGILSTIGGWLGFADGGTTHGNWLNKYADGGYTVKKGDNLTKISKKTGVSVAELVALNKIKDANKIDINQKLILPTTSSNVVTKKGIPLVASPASIQTINPFPAVGKKVVSNALTKGSPFGVYAANQPVQGAWPYTGQQSAIQGKKVKTNNQPVATKKVVVQTPQGPIMKEVVVDDRNMIQKMYQPEEGHIHKFQLPEDVYGYYQTNLPMNKGKKFGIVSKQNAKGYFFDENGNLAVQDEVGLGEQMGDTPNVFYKNKTTPAGAYVINRPKYTKEVFDKLNKEYQANNYFTIANQNNSIPTIVKGEGYNKTIDPTLAFHGIPTSLMDKRALLFDDNNIDNNCMSAGCINARRQLLDNPYFNDITSANLYVTPRTAPAPTKKKKMGGQPCYSCGGMYEDGGMTPDIHNGWLDQYADGGSMITDPRGQWAHPGQNTRIPGGRITMQGVPYPVLAKASNGMSTMMYPNREYNFEGASHVDEYPLLKAQDGINFMPTEDPEMMYVDKFNTPLNKKEQKEFDQWAAKESKRRGRNILMDKGAYDVQGFWKSGDYKKMDKDNHGTDTWKKPNHPTFSNQSNYHGLDGFYGGNWTNEAGYQPSKQTADMYGPSYYSRLFAEEPNRPEHLDASRFMSGVNRPSPLYYKQGGSLLKAQDGLGTFLKENKIVGCKRGVNCGVGTTTGEKAGVENFGYISNAPVSSKELANSIYEGMSGKERRAKEAEVKARLGQLQTQYPGLTLNQLNMAMGDSARFNAMLPSHKVYDDPKWQTYANQFYPALRGASATPPQPGVKVTVPQILNQINTFPGGYGAYEAITGSNYTRPKQKLGGEPNWLGKYIR